MKPFDINLAKQGKPVCTRDGREVRILCFDLKSTSRPIVAAVQYEDNKEYEYVTTYTVLGHHFCNRVDEEDDLMMKSEKRQGWINLYESAAHENGVVTSGYVYETEEIAKRDVTDDGDYIGTFPFEWEE